MLKLEKFNQKIKDNEAEQAKVWSYYLIYLQLTRVPYFITKIRVKPVSFVCGRLVFILVLELLVLIQSISLNKRYFRTTFRFYRLTNLIFSRQSYQKISPERRRRNFWTISTCSDIVLLTSIVEQRLDSIMRLYFYLCLRL